MSKISVGYMIGEKIKGKDAKCMTTGNMPMSEQMRIERDKKKKKRRGAQKVKPTLKEE